MIKSTLVRYCDCCGKQKEIVHLRPHRETEAEEVKGVDLCGQCCWEIMNVVIKGVAEGEFKKAFLEIQTKKEKNE